MNPSNFDLIIDSIWARKVAFAGVFFVIFLSSYAVLAWLEFLPEPRQEAAAESVIEVETTGSSSVSSTTETVDTNNQTNSGVVPKVVSQAPILPESITIDRLDRTVDVINPTSRSIEDLDAALLYGVVRHPDSATLDQTGTVFILGHSSYLPTVRNRNFQAFNGLQTLRFGDLITLRSDGVDYVYRVDRVYRANASELVVPIAGSTKKLVLATCNSFGSVDDRFIVEADLIETNPVLALGLTI